MTEICRKKDVISMTEDLIRQEQTESGEDTATEQILADFRAYLERRQLAERTVQSYLHGAAQFLGLYRSISSDNLKLYKCYLMEHYKPQTVNLRIRSINCLLESLHLTGYRMTMIHIQQKSFLENVISQADYEYLKQCLLRDGDRLYYFIIRVMATTGMRVSELVQLRVEDVRRGYIDLYSKGNKFRRVYIPIQVRRECLKWLSQEKRRRGYVFLNHFGEPITPSGIRRQLRKFEGRYGLEGAVLHPHSFRHLFARNFIEKCGDLPLLSDILGHESIETTRIYLHRSPSEQKQLVNQIVNW